MSLETSGADKPTMKYPAVGGFRIGILHVESGHQILPGNVQHAGSFDFPVMYQKVSGVPAAAVMRGDPAAGAAIIDSALSLQAAGVDVVVGACGSFANYQLEVAAALNIPVYMSILLEVPLLLRALPHSRQLGIIFARAAAFTDRVRENCAITASERIVTAELEGAEAFAPLMAQRGMIDHARLREQVLQVACQTLRANPRIGAWLIQCSDLPPYASDIHAATGLPVHDMVGLINHVHAACAPRRYAAR
jgi:hypothetical protein